MFNTQPELIWTHWDTLTSAYGVVVLLGFIWIMITEKDRMIRSFVKRPRWNLLAFGIFTPIWFWMVLTVEGDDESAD